MVADNHYKLESRGSEIDFEGTNLAVFGDAIAVEGTSYQEMAEYLKIWGSELHLRKAELRMSAAAFMISQISDSPAEIRIPINFSGITGRPNTMTCRVGWYLPTCEQESLRSACKSAQSAQSFPV